MTFETVYSYLGFIAYYIYVAALIAAIYCVRQRLYLAAIPFMIALMPITAGLLHNFGVIAIKTHLLQYVVVPGSNIGLYLAIFSLLWLMAYRGYYKLTLAVFLPVVLYGSIAPLYYFTSGDPFYGLRAALFFLMYLMILMLIILLGHLQRRRQQRKQSINRQ